MNIQTYHIDAFTSRLFCGNPAKVCLLEDWLPSQLLQSIATENNLPATAFLVRDGDEYSIRWFAPDYEIDLCGHGSLAAGFVILRILEPSLQQITLRYAGGLLVVKTKGDLITLSLPARNIEPTNCPEELTQGLGKQPTAVYRYQNERCLAVFENETDIQNMIPNIGILQQLEYRGIIVTAPGVDSDFVSRVFYPHKQMAEDPVTGSSHCLLVPYWSQQFGKLHFNARQLSKRGGDLVCELLEDRILLSGHAVLYMQGTLSV